MGSKITKLEKIKVKKFRGLTDLDINLGNRITVICGKNGTSKSTILGMIAQIFIFDKDYSTNTDLEFKTLAGKPFKSLFSEHFRLSAIHDSPGSMDVEYELYDAFFGAHINDLRLALYNYADRPKPRAVTRNNIVTDIADNSSRNVTHPVIYLSLKRLLPIAQRNKYQLSEEIEYLEKIKNEFTRANDKMLGKSSGKHISGTTGTIDSMVVHGDCYDHESVSVGEDNTGQILQALYSFQKLKEEYPDYHGGMLLIDELDAGLFPAAQLELIKILESFSRKLDLQVVFTTHSPIVIQDIFEKSKHDKSNNKTVYLTDTFGKVEVAENYSWDKIVADLFIETTQIEVEKKIPKTKIYFEDNEAYEFFRILVRERNVNKIIEPLKDITLGCKNYIDLINRKITEFSKNSIVVFDGDEPAGNKYKNTICLPSELPPDQLLFDFLYRLPSDHAYWKNNKRHFTKPVFLKTAANILEFLDLSGTPSDDYDLKKIIEFQRKESQDSSKGKAREKFKNFYKSEIIQSLIKGNIAENPFKVMIDSEPDKYLYFQESFKKTLLHVIENTHPSMKFSVAEFLKI